MSKVSKETVNVKKENDREQATIQYVQAFKDIALSCKKNTSLHLAVINGDIRLTQTIITENKELINTVDDNGNTPLHIAVGLYHVVIVKILINAKASINILSNDPGRSPLHLAISYGQSYQTDIFKLLISAGADLFQERKAGYLSSLSLIAFIGNLNLVKAVIEIAYQDKDLLWKMCVIFFKESLRYNRDDIIKFLAKIYDVNLLYHALPNPLDKLEEAIRIGRFDAIEALCETNFEVNEIYNNKVYETLGGTMTIMDIATFYYNRHDHHAYEIFSVMEILQKYGAKTAAQINAKPAPTPSASATLILSASTVSSSAATAAVTSITGAVATASSATTAATIPSKPKM